MDQNGSLFLGSLIGCLVTIEMIVNMPESLHLFYRQRCRLKNCPEVAREEAEG